jgi:hypothetical protein
MAAKMLVIITIIGNIIERSCAAVAAEAAGPAGALMQLNVITSSITAHAAAAVAVSERPDEQLVSVDLGSSICCSLLRAERL